MCQENHSFLPFSQYPVTKHMGIGNSLEPLCILITQPITLPYQILTYHLAPIITDGCGALPNPSIPILIPNHIISAFKIKDQYRQYWAYRLIRRLRIGASIFFLAVVAQHVSAKKYWDYQAANYKHFYEASSTKQSAIKGFLK